MRAHRLGLLAAASLLLVMAVGCSSVPGLNEVSGSGNPVTKEYDYTGFTGLSIDQTAHVTVTQGDSFAVTVTVDDNLVEHLRVELQGDRLHIGMDGSNRYVNATLRADVTMPELEALDVSGASSADVTDLASQKPLDVQVSGASRVELGSVRAGDVTLDISGASRLTGQLVAEEIGGEVSGAGEVSLEGTASRVDLEASGAGKLDLQSLIVKDADLQLSGGASGTVHVSGTLSVDASGGARLEYYGSPTSVDSEISGGAEVSAGG